MLVRIVKMSFFKEHIEEFLAIFEGSKSKIRCFEGCELLELYQDRKNSNVFFTYSHWNSEADLEDYRQSDLFKTVWAKTKVLFNKKAEAWSVDIIATLHLPTNISE